MWCTVVADGGGGGTPTLPLTTMTRKLRLGCLCSSAPPRERLCRAACNEDAWMHGGGEARWWCAAAADGGSGTPSLAQVGTIRKLRLGCLRSSTPLKERVCRVVCNGDTWVQGWEGISVGGAAVADGGGNGTLPGTSGHDQEITARTSARLSTTQGTCVHGAMQQGCPGARWGGDQSGCRHRRPPAAAAAAPSLAQVGMMRKLRLERLSGSVPPRRCVCRVPCNGDA